MGITFTKAQKASLDSLGIDLNTTKAGVLRAALALLQTTIKEEKAGGTIAVIKNGKIVKTITGITNSLPRPYGGSH